MVEPNIPNITTYNLDMKNSKHYKSVWTDLTCETEANAKGDAAGNEHGQVLGGSIEGRAEQEEEGSNENGGLAAACPGEAGCDQERGEQRGHVERRCEECQNLAVEETVIARFHIVPLLVHVREELQQEIVHGSHPPL